MEIIDRTQRKRIFDRLIEMTSAKYARIADRDTDSVLTKDGSNRKLYLTDQANTYVVALTAGADQAVVMESVDTESDKGSL